MSAFSVYPGGSRAPLRTSESSQPRQSQPRQDDMNHLPTPHDGLPKNYLPPFHRSSSPSVTREGKENGYSNQRGDSRQNQPPIDTLRNQKSGNISDMARNEEERRNQAAWSPHRGRRDERSKGSTSASTLNGNGQSAPSSTNVDDVNRDFERLLVSPVTWLIPILLTYTPRDPNRTSFKYQQLCALASHPSIHL